MKGNNIGYKTVSSPIYYHLTNRRVTENFVDTSGAKITPPSNFTKGNKRSLTVILLVQQRFYVTYDDNDDLTVVYEEFSGYELPASTNQFGFVDEATNKLIAPDQVQMKYNLTLNENNKNSNEQ